MPASGTALPQHQAPHGGGHQFLMCHQFLPTTTQFNGFFFLWEFKQMFIRKYTERPSSYPEGTNLHRWGQRSPWTSQQWGHTRSGHFIGYLQHPHPCYRLQSQRSPECFQPSDKLNLPDSLDLPLVLRDAFTSSWLRRRQTCSDTFVVSQSHFSPCDLLLPVSLSCTMWFLRWQTHFDLLLPSLPPPNDSPSPQFFQILHDCFIK